MYYLENIGWKIKQIGTPIYPSYTGGYDFRIEHKIFAPLGEILQKKTIREVIEYIETTYLSPCKFLGETKEEVPRREYAFKHAADQEQFAKFWGGWPVTNMVDGNWNVLI